jgi:prepilin peptidase CpaA
MPLATLIFLIFALAAALCDIATRRIPNWLTLAMALSFAVEVYSNFQGWEALGWHVAAASLVLFAGFGLHALGIMGGGDGKLLAAVALWIGWSQLVPLLVFTAILGGLIALYFILLRRLANHPALAMLPLPLPRRLKPGIPYGVAISAAAICLKASGLTLI